tara:strand:+ start:16410 stop:16874 length:465 start_codon:yes stop_codon:yes gene_type:complete
MVKLLLFSFICFFYIEISIAEIRSLKNTKVNVRLGPSKNYPIKFVYEKKYLPVLIIDEHYNWKKIKDFENDTGWIHISQLSKLKTTLTTKNNEVIYSSPSIYSKPKVKLEIYQVLTIKKCKQLWCNVENSKIHGWIKKKNLWGIKNTKTTKNLN